MRKKAGKDREAGHRRQTSIAAEQDKLASSGKHGEFNHNIIIVKVQ